MSIHKKYLAIVLLLFTLTGCEEKTDYAYLMRHPDVLQKEIIYCNSTNPKTPEVTTHCDIVAYAAGNFSTMVIDQQEDPQKFGQRVLRAQMECVNAKKDWQMQLSSLDALKAKNVSATELAAVQNKVDKAKQNYQERMEEVRVMLSVLSLGRPE